MARRYLLIAFLTLSALVAPALQQEASARVELIDYEAQQVKISFVDNKLTVTGAMGKTLQVFNLIGRVVMTVKIDSPEKTIDLGSLPKGACPVRVGNVTKKISILGR